MLRLIGALAGEWGKRLASHIDSYRFVGTNIERSSNGIKIDFHERSQSMYIYVCVCVCMCVYMYVCMYVCMHVYIYVCMYVCMHVCIYVCMCVCMCIYRVSQEERT